MLRDIDVKRRASKQGSGDEGEQELDHALICSRGKPIVKRSTRRAFPPHGGSFASQGGAGRDLTMAVRPRIFNL